ncbi:hypothetical protein IAT38_000221 [Cryptococcus sp. DSM 104549]
MANTRSYVYNGRITSAHVQELQCELIRQLSLSLVVRPVTSSSLSCNLQPELSGGWTEGADKIGYAIASAYVTSEGKKEQFGTHLIISKNTAFTPNEKDALDRYLEKMLPEHKLYSAVRITSNPPRVTFETAGTRSFKPSDSPRLTLGTPPPAAGDRMEMKIAPRASSAFSVPPSSPPPLPPPRRMPASAPASVIAQSSPPTPVVIPSSDPRVRFASPNASPPPRAPSSQPLRKPARPDAAPSKDLKKPAPVEPPKRVLQITPDVSVKGRATARQIGKEQEIARVKAELMKLEMREIGLLKHELKAELRELERGMRAGGGRREGLAGVGKS